MILDADPSGSRRRERRGACAAGRADGGKRRKHEETEARTYDTFDGLHASAGVLEWRGEGVER